MEDYYLRVIRFNPHIRPASATSTAAAYGAKIARLEVNHPGAAALVKRLIDQSLDAVNEHA